MRHFLVCVFFLFCFLLVCFQFNIPKQTSYSYFLSIKNQLMISWYFSFSLYQAVVLEQFKRKQRFAHFFFIGACANTSLYLTNTSAPANFFPTLSTKAFVFSWPDHSRQYPRNAVFTWQTLRFEKFASIVSP